MALGFGIALVASMALNVLLCWVIKRMQADYENELEKNIQRIFELLKTPNENSE